GVHAGALLAPRTTALFHNLQMLQSSAGRTGVLAPRTAAIDFTGIPAMPRPPVPQSRTAATENGRWQGLMANGKAYLCRRPTRLGRPRRLWGIVCSFVNGLADRCNFPRGNGLCTNCL